MILSNLEHFPREWLYFNLISLLFHVTGQSTSGIGASGGNEVVIISPRPGTLDWFKTYRIVRNETWLDTSKWERELDNCSRELIQRQKIRREMHRQKTFGQEIFAFKYCNKIPHKTFSIVFDLILSRYS